MDFDGFFEDWLEDEDEEDLGPGVGYVEDEGAETSHVEFYDLMRTFFAYLNKFNQLDKKTDFWQMFLHRARELAAASLST